MSKRKLPGHIRDQRIVVDAMPFGKNISFYELQKVTGLSQGVVSASLIVAEVHGFVIRLPGACYRRIVDDPYLVEVRKQEFRR